MAKSMYTQLLSNTSTLCSKEIEDNKTYKTEASHFAAAAL